MGVRVPPFAPYFSFNNLRLILVCSTFPVFSVRLRLGCVLLRRGERIQTIDEAAVPSRNQVDIFLRCDLDGTVSHLIANVWQRSACLMNPSKVIELFKLGEGSSPTLGIKTADVVDGFCSFLFLAFRGWLIVLWCAPWTPRTRPPPSLLVMTLRTDKRRRACARLGLTRYS